MPDSPPGVRAGGDPTARVLMVEPVLLHFRRRFYQRLHRLLAEESVGLRVVHSNPPAGGGWRHVDLPAPWCRRVPAWRLGDPGGPLWQWAVGPALAADLVIASHAARMGLNYLLALARYAGGPAVALWGHGTDRSGRTSRTPEALRRWLLRRAQWYLAYTETVADVVAERGFPRERVTVVDNATDTRAIARRVGSVSDDELAALDDRLGVDSGRVGLFVGSLEPRKQLGFLLEAGDRISRLRDDFHLVVAGGGPGRPRLRRESRRRAWLHVVGPSFGHELAVLLRRASVLLIPSWVGLVIVDGFGAGVPTVASAGFPHPPEIAYLRDGVNGLLVEDCGKPAAYARAVVDLLGDPPRLSRLREGCRRERERLSAERMAANFRDGVLAALAAG